MAEQGQPCSHGEQAGATSAPLLTTCVALSRPSVLPEPQFLHVKNRGRDSNASQGLVCLPESPGHPIKAAITVIIIVNIIIMTPPNLREPERAIMEFTVLFNKAQLV